MSSLFHSLKFGSDPELFIRHKKTGKLVSAHNMIPGDKKNPHKVPKGAIQVDGLAAEFNIDPCSSQDEWIENHAAVIKELEHYMGSSYELVYEPIAWFSKDYFDTLPEETKMLGCDPDYNAWTGQKNPPPNAAQLEGDDGAVLRTASGHIHIGWTDSANIDDEAHRQRCFELVKIADRRLTYAMISRPAGPLLEMDRTRRSLYGKAGACRIKPYGVEVRSPSNLWLTGGDLWRRAAFQQARKAAVQYFLGQTLTKQEQEEVMKRLG